MALRFDGFDDELVFAALFVNVDAASYQDLDAVFGFEFQPPVSELPADAFDLGVGIFEGEVTVAAGDGFGAGDFTGNPDVGEVAVEGGTDAVAEFAEGVDAAVGNKAQGCLFH